MAPTRQFLIWSVPSLAVILGLLWFKRKKGFLKSDPGGKKRISVKEEVSEILNASKGVSTVASLPNSQVAEKVTVKSSPIDIVPNGSGSLKSSPIIYTEKEVDLQIEKFLNKSYGKTHNSSLKNVGEKSIPSSGWNENSYNKSRGKNYARSLPVRKSVLPTVNHSFSDILIKEDIKYVNTEGIVDEEKDLPNILKSIDTKELKLDQDPFEENQESDTNKMALERSESEEVVNMEHVEEKNDESVELEEKSSGSDDLRHSAERDSANHSPVDAILASPAISHFSDNHSEGSSDSGKGCSEAASPPPATLATMQPVAGLRFYQFLIPQSLVGILIGRQGYYVTQIKLKTGAHVYVKRHPESTKMKVCVVEGTAAEITAALDMIRSKFPERRFPQITLQEVTAELCEGLIVPEFLQLQLVEAVNNDALVSCLVTAGHLFLQQPTHPSFPALPGLHRLMGAAYALPGAPALPTPVSEGAICAAPTENNWYRAQVISTNEENDTSLVKLVDFGGYLSVENCQLKQIRSDFMTLPFQATEAMLASIRPTDGEWSEEALQVMAGLTVGQLLQAQVAGYDEVGMPLVYLYLTLGAQQVIFLNKELVERGLAEWDLPVEC